MQGWPQRHRISVEHFYRMADAGLFDADGRVELVDGEIIDMPPTGPLHAAVVEQVTRALSAELPADIVVRAQSPVRLAEYSEPLPDVCVARPRSDRYTLGHPEPEDVLLLIEVSDSTLRYDREVKAALYARHGVPELWIMDLQARLVLRHTQVGDGRYARVDALRFEPIPVAATGAVLDLARLVIGRSE
jgi:Uma2 family endonuclease